jgi:hypothetical protein
VHQEREEDREGDGDEHAPREIEARHRHDDGRDDHQWLDRAQRIRHGQRRSKRYASPI